MHKGTDLQPSGVGRWGCSAQPLLKNLNNAAQDFGPTEYAPSELPTCALRILQFVVLHCHTTLLGMLDWWLPFSAQHLTQWPHMQICGNADEICFAQPAVTVHGWPELANPQGNVYFVAERREGGLQRFLLASCK